MTKALIVIDVQNDFCPNGALAVPGGDEIIEGINELMDDFPTVILSQDWHPRGHSSFASEHKGKNPLDMVKMSYGDQVLWPDHCIQGEKGSKFHKKLWTNGADMIIRKGQNPKIDSYSAFFENDKKTTTGLQGYLRTKDISEVTLVGLATDFCVCFSAIDAKNLGFKTSVRMDLCRAIDLDGSLTRARRDMMLTGVELLNDKDGSHLEYNG